MQPIQHTNLRTVKMGGFTLLRYNKPLLDPGLANYRSVIFQNDRLVSYTPPKSLDFELFKAKYPISEVRVEEFMDGTMVYAYCVGETWRLGTRSVYDAATSYRCGTQVPRFSRTETFYPPAPPLVRDVFLEKVGPAFFENLRQDCVYVFSFMSPLTFNVVKGDGVYLVATYEIKDNEPRLLEPQLLPGVLLPTRHKFDSYEILAECADEVPYTCKGFMLHAGGERTKVMSTAFVRAKDVFDNQPNVNRCLLKLMREHRENLLLEMYPEYKPNAVQLANHVKTFTNILYGSYLECFVEKKKPLREYAYKHHLYLLHQHYCMTLRPAKKRINKQEVVTYVAGLHLNQLSAALNL
jgi:hypothetical protein